MRTLTPEEVTKLGLTKREKFALVSKTTGKLFIGSDVPGSVEETHAKMIENKHPQADDLELVTQP